MRMAQPCSKPRFVHEHVDECRVALQMGVEDLEDNDLPEVAHALGHGEVHLRHTAVAEFSDKRVPSPNRFISVGGSLALFAASFATSSKACSCSVCNTRPAPASDPGHEEVLG